MSREYWDSHKTANRRFSYQAPDLSSSAAKSSSEDFFLFSDTLKTEYSFAILRASSICERMSGGNSFKIFFNFASSASRISSQRPIGERSALIFSKS